MIYDDHDDLLWWSVESVESVETPLNQSEMHRSSGQTGRLAPNIWSKVNSNLGVAMATPWHEQRKTGNRYN